MLFKSGSKAPPLLGTGEESLDDVAIFVPIRIKLGRVPTFGAFAFAVINLAFRSGQTNLIPRLRQWPQLAADEYDRSAITTSGRTRGRPAPDSLETRSSSRTSGKTTPPWRCAPVTMMTIARFLPSTPSMCFRRKPSACPAYSVNCRFIAQRRGILAILYHRLQSLSAVQTRSMQKAAETSAALSCQAIASRDCERQDVTMTQGKEVACTTSLPELNP